MLLECKTCEATVDAVELSNYEDHSSQEDPPAKYTFLKCPRCHRPFLVLQDNFWGEWDHPYPLYPPQDKHVNPSIPPAIRIAFQEAKNCFKNKTFTASAIMCRKTLEGICDEHEIEGRTLASRLKKMKEQGLIENRLFEWAEALRISGNEAAHDVRITISNQDAKDIVEFTEALLEYVYTYREKFDMFLLRRGHKTDEVAVSVPGK